jgi:hypothetical protein
MEKETVKLGFGVVTALHCHRGVVYGITHDFAGVGESMAWFRGLVPQLSPSTLKERWIKILCDGAGSVTVPESDVREVTSRTPADNGNPWIRFYFDLPERRVIDSPAEFEEWLDENSATIAAEFVNNRWENGRVQRKGRRRRQGNGGAVRRTEVRRLARRRARADHERLQDSRIGKNALRGARHDARARGDFKMEE